MNRSLEHYPHVRELIGPADLLLFRRRGLWRAIGRYGRSEFSHAGKAVWWDGDLFLAEVTGFHGGRVRLLSREVQRQPGSIDVFETNPDHRWPEFKPWRAARFMRRLAGCRYGWGNLVLAGLLHLPVVRLFVRADVDDRARYRRPPFCSQACVMADRIGGGVDPVPHLADRLTEPADLARSPFYRYRFTLIP